MKHVWACVCGTEVECRPEDDQAGAVFRCIGCQQVWGCLRQPHGGRAWVKVEEDDVIFHGLLDSLEVKP
jgi:hypothetical protein